MTGIAPYVNITIMRIELGKLTPKFFRREISPTEEISVSPRRSSDELLALAASYDFSKARNPRLRKNPGIVAYLHDPQNLPNLDVSPTLFLEEIEKNGAETVTISPWGSVGRQWTPWEHKPDHPIPEWVIEYEMNVSGVDREDAIKNVEEEAKRLGDLHKKGLWPY